MKARTPGSRPPRVRLRDRLKLAAFHAAARMALRGFERQLRQAPGQNRDALAEILKLNAESQFGLTHQFTSFQTSGDPVAAYRDRVPLSTYSDYEPYLTRIAAGERSVLGTEPVHMLAGSSGTTDRPKRIPRTHRAQRHHMRLVVLAEQAVVDRVLPAARRPYRGINLMSCYAPAAPEASQVPVLAGPNVGLARMRRHMPLLWCAPPPVYEVADAEAALYLQALFALRETTALYIQAPFAPQIVAWFALIERQRRALVADLRRGTLAPELKLTLDERQALVPYLRPDPDRADAVDAVLGDGLAGAIPRLWPNLAYVRTVTSGSFSLSLPRLRWLCGPELLIHSGCHSSSEGVIGINLNADGSTDYVLAVGTAFFEFIPLAVVDAHQPKTVDLADLTVGEEYELVLTSCAGLYRYRLGDVIRITGWHQTAPTFQFLYRRGTLLNLAGEKTSEFHTAEAVRRAVDDWLDEPDAVHEYTVCGTLGEGVGRYTFYVELATARIPTDLPSAEALLDESLGAVNPYYRSSGRLPGRLAAASLKVVRPGTFAALLDLQRRNAAPVTATQVKVPRVVTHPEQLALLESQVWSDS